MWNIKNNINDKYLFVYLIWGEIRRIAPETYMKAGYARR